MDASPHSVEVPLLTDEERRELETQGHVLRRSAGHVFVEEGEQTDAVLLIRRGQVKVTIGNPATIVAIRASGDLVGEMAAIRAKPRCARIVAMTEVEVLRLEAIDWLQFLYAHPRAMHGLLSATGARLEESNRKIADSNLPVEQRLAKSLLELASSEAATRADDAVRVPVSQTDLAAMARASPDSIKKVVRRLKEDDVVRTGRNETIVRDIAALAEIAAGSGTSPPTGRRGATARANAAAGTASSTH